jgi:hypothetical protein
MTIGGIIRAAENLLSTIEVQEIIEAVRCGLLSRNGQYVTLTELGEALAEGDQAAWDAWTRSGQSPGSRQP